MSSFIKKSFSLNGHQPFHNIITNKQINEIEEYNNIISLAYQQAQGILDNANLEANNIIEHANQQAQNILTLSQQEAEHKIANADEHTKNIIAEAEDKVQDIVDNSEQKATLEVWDKAADLINNLERAHNEFYIHTNDLIKNILATIIKRLTSSLDVQDKMQVLVTQVFAKAQEIEYATLFFNFSDFEQLPNLHIPMNWKVEKDNMLDKGWCRLVGAGGEWKTSIALIERKILESIEYKNINIPEPIQESEYNIESDLGAIDPKEINPLDTSEYQNYTHSSIQEQTSAKIEDGDEGEGNDENHHNKFSIN